FADVPLVGAGALRELARREPARTGERLVEAERVADADERGRRRRAEIADQLPEELVDGGGRHAPGFGPRGRRSQEPTAGATSRATTSSCSSRCARLRWRRRRFTIVAPIAL